MATMANFQGDYRMAGTNLGNTDPTQYIAANVNPLWRHSTADLGGLYNVTYDEGTIRNKFNTATKAEYNTKKQEYANTERAAAQNLYTLQQTQTDSIRRAMAQGLATGTDASTAILSAITGTQQEGTALATDLANQRNLLHAQESEAYTQNARDALEMSNQLGLSLGDLSTQMYGLDVQSLAAQLQYYASLDAASKQFIASKYNTDKNYTIARNQLQAGGYYGGPGDW